MIRLMPASSRRTRCSFAAGVLICSGWFGLVQAANGQSNDYSHPLNDSFAIAALISALNNPEVSARENAMRALGETQDPRAIDALIAALTKDTSIQARQVAAKALVKIGTPTVGPLIAAAKNPDPNVRAAGIQMLGQFNDPRATEPLLAALHDPSPYVRSSATRSFHHQHDELRIIESLTPLLEDPENSVRVDAVCAIGNYVAIPRAFEILIDAFGSPDPGVRRWALSSVSPSSDPRKVEPMIRLLQDPDPNVRREAGSAVSEIRDPRAADALQDSLARRDVAVIVGAYSYFVQEGEEGSEDTLVEALKSQFGHEGMAETFAYCGNALLEEAGRAWLTDHPLSRSRTISSNGTPNTAQWARR